MKKRISGFAIALAVMLALCTCVYAATSSRVADFMGWIGFHNHGETIAQSPEENIFAVDQTFELGNVVYTLDEVVYENGVLYGTGVIRLKEDVTGVLYPEDYMLTDHVGFTEHYSMDEEIPADALTYAQAAEKLQCNLTLPTIVPNGYYEGDQLVSGDIGYGYAPYADGSIGYYFEIWGVDPEIPEGDANEADYFGGIEESNGYKIQLHVANWEVTPDGEWLRDDAETNTWLKTDWDVEIVSAQQAE